MTVLIPALNPDEHLIALISQLQGMDVLIVDDGSDAAHQPIFDAARALGATVLVHSQNKGKGAAMKTGFAYLLEKGQEGTGVVCADADGQHTPQDITRVAAAIGAQPQMVLGTRSFSLGKGTPFKSWLGNRTVSLAFLLSCGKWLPDTQTGLRGFPISLLPFLLSVPGDRFEYEMNQLLAARPNGIGYRCVPIETLYFEKNAASHYHVWRDSLRILNSFLRFGVASLVCTGVDYGLVFGLKALLGGLFLPIVVARTTSAILNFFLNRRLVFAQTQGSLVRQALGYFPLAATIMGLNYLMVLGLTHAGLGLFPAKLITDILLFIVSFMVQRLVIFRRRPAHTL
nr:bifunctional glycosyltransferase family 2/GtrA family protein [bacterium]